MRRVPVLIAVLLTLTGCVLQSAKALIPADAGELVLAGIGSRFATYSLHGGQWQKEDDTITFTANGRQYAASDGKTTVSVTFKVLPGGRWLMQGEEPGKPFAYMLLERDGKDIYLLPLACTAMQAAGTFAALVEFQKDDCYAKDGVDAAALFAAAAGLPVERVSKMVALD